MFLGFPGRGLGPDSSFATWRKGFCALNKGVLTGLPYLSGDAEGLNPRGLGLPLNHRSECGAWDRVGALLASGLLTCFNVRHQTPSIDQSHASLCASLPNHSTPHWWPVSVGLTRKDQIVQGRTAQVRVRTPFASARESNPVGLIRSQRLR